MLITTQNNLSNGVSTIVEGGATISIMAFFSDSMAKTLPWLLLAIPLLVLDLLYGVRAAGYRGEKVRASTAVRRSIDKAVAYIMWCTAAVMLDTLFEIPWLDKAVLAAVFGNEIVSIWGHKLELQGVEINFTNLWRFIFRKGSEKYGMAADKEEVEQIIKPRRDARGRFVKKQ